MSVCELKVVKKYEIQNTLVPGGSKTRAKAHGSSAA